MNVTARAPHEQLAPLEPEDRAMLSAPGCVPRIARTPHKPSEALVVLQRAPGTAENVYGGRGRPTARGSLGASFVHPRRLARVLRQGENERGRGNSRRPQGWPRGGDPRV